MTTRPKQRDPLGCLADVLVEDILETPGVELLAESAEDRREARALSVELDARIKRLLKHHPERNDDSKKSHHVLGKFEPRGSFPESGEERWSKAATGTSDADFVAAAEVGLSGLPRRWRSAHEPTVHVRGKRMKPFVRQSHAGTFGRPVGFCRSHLLARACSPRNLQVAVAAMLVFIAVAGSAALHWTSTSSIDEFTRAVSPATAPLPSEPARLPASPPSQAADSAGPGAIPEAAAGRQQAPAVRYRVQLSWQRSQEAAVDDLLTRPDLQAKFPPLRSDPASVIREVGHHGPVSLGGFSVEQARDFCEQFKTTGGDCSAYQSQ